MESGDGNTLNLESDEFEYFQEYLNLFFDSVVGACRHEILVIILAKHERKIYNKLKIRSHLTTSSNRFGTYGHYNNPFRLRNLFK